MSKLLTNGRRQNDHSAQSPFHGLPIIPSVYITSAAILKCTNHDKGETSWMPKVIHLIENSRSFVESKSMIWQVTVRSTLRGLTLFRISFSFA